ncbi:hypothetical protein D3C80_1062360 [compost metagenome]
MQGIPGRGDGRQFAGLEHDNLEVAQTAGDQAVEGILQTCVIVLQIDHHKGHLRRRIFTQVGKNSLAGGAVRAGVGDCRKHLARRRARQLRLDTRNRQQLELLQPDTEVVAQPLILLTEACQQELAYLRVEHTQCKCLPVAGHEALGGIVGMFGKQCLLPYPGPLQSMAVELAGGPGMDHELGRTQLTEHGAVVVGHFDELGWLERQLRFGRQAVPARSEQQWRLATRVGIAHEGIEDFEPLGVGKYCCLLAVPVLELAHSLAQQFFAGLRAEGPGTVLDHCAGVRQQTGSTLGQQPVGNRHAPAIERQVRWHTAHRGFQYLGAHHGPPRLQTVLGVHANTPQGAAGMQLRLWRGTDPVVSHLAITGLVTQRVTLRHQVVCVVPQGLHRCGDAIGQEEITLQGQHRKRGIDLLQGLQHLLGPVTDRRLRRRRCECLQVCKARLVIVSGAP